MSDLNDPNRKDGVLGDEPRSDLDEDVATVDDAEVAGAPVDEPGGLGKIPMPPD